MVNGQAGRNTHEIYDMDENLIAEGNLDYIGEKISVFSVHGIFHKDMVKGRVRIMSRLRYEEVYDANVDEIEDNRIMLKTLRNVSGDLRQDLKIEYRGNIELEYTDKDESGKEKIFLAKGKMENISGGGIGFISENVFRVGQVLVVKTNIPDLSLETKIKILRKENFGRLYKYGCRFHDISRTEESSIRKVVYKLQLDMRNYNKARENEWN